MPEVVRMDVASLLESVRAAGIELRVEGTRLRFKAPEGAFTDAMRAGLLAHRDDVIRYLRDEAARSITTGPLAANQAGMWFLQRLVPSNTAYNLALAVRIHGAFDIAVLEESLQTLVDRHESLRTSYPLSDGEPVRLVAGHTPVSIVMVPAEGWSEARLDAGLRKHYSEPFDLEHGPLLRARVYRETPDRHVLLLVAHHISVDGTSLFVLLEELFEAYETLSAGRPAPERDGSAEFAQFVSWQSAPSDATDPARRYWHDVLTPPPPPLDLPVDRPRARIRAMAGGTHWHELAPDLATALRAQARAFGVTDYVFLMALWFVFLNRLSAQDDITVGTPVHGRPSARFTRTIGDFVNTLPLRLIGISDATFTEVVSRVRSIVLQGMTHQDFPLPRMMENHVSSSGAGSAPFHTLFILQDFTRFEQIEKLMLGSPHDRVPFGSLELSPVRMDQQESQFELSLDVWPRTDTLLLAWRYDSDLLDLRTVKRWIRTFESVARAVIDAPDTPVAHLAVLSPQDRSQLNEWNATEREYREGVTLDQLLSERALRDPSAVAIVAESGVAAQLTYGELERRANALAACLQELGVGADVRVAVNMERSVELVVALVAVLKAGGSYVPVDPSYPAERRAFMLEDCGAPVVLTQSSLAASLMAESGATVLCVDEIWAQLDRVGVVEPRSRPDSLAYIIYTSGSTGLPKGAMIEHRSIVNRLLWMQEHYGLTGDDVVLQKTPYSFDVSVWEFFWPLFMGARLVMARPEGHKDPTYLETVIRRESVTTLHFVPSMLSVFLDGLVDARLPSLRRVICSGEALSAALRDRFLARLPGVDLTNLYGPTEAAVDVSWWRCRPGDAAWTVPIGWPVANTRLYILDERMRPVPIGVTGELYIGGVQVGRGYLNRPELTAERFLDSPFTAGERLYRTGDRARYLNDGAIEFLGRLDHQVKLRGFRIELGEIEARLLAHADVSDAVVIARDDILLAYFVPRGAAPDRGAAPAIDTLRAWMSTTLPDYMVPAVFVPLESLPLTPSGKVDRNALPSAAFGDTRTRECVAPRTAEERLVASSWAEVLEVEDISVDDNFFELGGHSLAAARVVSRITAASGVDLPLRHFFDHPTVEAIAAWIGTKHDGSVRHGIVYRERTEAPVSFIQERLWFLQQFAPDSAAYNLSVALRLEGGLDTGRLFAAIDQVVVRHDALRTTLRVRNGVPFQYIAAESDYDVLIEDMSSVPSRERADRARELVSAFMERPYRLDEGPLFRVALVQLGEDSHLLGLGTHHAISDQWSIGVLLREIAAFHDSDDVSSPPVLELQYGDFAEWQRALFETSAMAGQVEYWREQLHGVEPLDLPIDRQRPRIQSSAGRYATAQLAPGVTDRISALSLELGVTPFALMLAVYDVVLHAFTGQADIAVGAPIATRPHPALENLIGSFLNVLVYRTDLSGDPSFGDIARSVRETALDAASHQDVPFEMLIQALDIARDTSRPPLAQVLFNVANAPVPTGIFPKLRVDPVMLDRSAAQFELSMHVHDSTLYLEYNTDLFTEAMAERVLGMYHSILDRVLSDPNAALHTLVTAPPQDRSQLDEWNAMERPFPAADVPALIGAAAQRTPAAIAVESPTGSFTYAELIDYAQRVTAALQSIGVKPGDRVAIVMQRSREMAGALIGILGAGAAYVPVDPSYPAARVQYMLEDSAAVAIVTHRGLEASYSPAVRILDLERRTPPTPAAFVSAVPEQAAYVIYTSGSTGKPKGVEVPHRALANFLLSMRERPGIAPHDAILAVTTISFDIAVLELYLPLIAGARVVIAGEDEALDGRRLMRRIDDAGITLMQATPATWKLLIAAGWPGKHDLRVLCGGEALSVTLADELLDRVPELWNMYGPTETTVWSTLDRVERDAPVLVGRPIANTTVYVLDDALDLRPIGVPGELYIGGAGVANGYVNRPDLTAERFVASPFREGERLYRTGDLVRFRSDGRLEHLGRLDSQVKIRGFRIELGEVESAMQSHSAVRDAVAVASDDRLVAYVVFEPGMHATITDLRAWVSSTLPPYMVPSFIMPMDALPLTPNGKVDRKQLPDPSEHAPEPAETSEPTDPAGRMIAEIWSSLLGLERVGRGDNFFEIGGHSLLAMQVVALIEERTGFRPEPRSLFFMTLGELADSIDSSVTTA